MAVPEPSDQKDKSAAMSRESIANAIYAELEREIVEGDLDAGDRINENAIAEARGISRGPVREACRLLQQAGLIEFKVNRGFFVRIIEIEDVLEIYEVRAALFADAGRRLAECITQEQIDDLAHLQELMEAAHDKGDADTVYLHNREFHALTISFVGNKRMTNIYEALDRELHIWRKRALILDSNVTNSLKEHHLILDALRGANPTVCANIFRDHSLAGFNRLMRTMPERISKSGRMSPPATSHK
ncbi:FCD domain-containing protein [uncultured Cohaesibacter sp.]|uniref:GntR family transcriptional regulator n=1 Tax=uncultured Cohaesibacter sp. TaxID=1002546 RepID=UPI0029C93013|nr:FCD domain-containing protein [uncultured Cohaesibacter sp.]